MRYLSGTPLRNFFQSEIADVLRDDDFWEVENQEGSLVLVAESGRFLTSIELIGTGLSVDFDTGRLSGTVTEIKIRQERINDDDEDDDRFSHVVLPGPTNLQDLYDAANAVPVTRPVTPTTAPDFFRLLMPENSPFPDLFFTGSDGRDKVVGFDGNDQVNTGPGRDTIFASEGDDILDGEGGKDTFDTRRLVGPVTIDLAAGTGSMSANGRTHTQTLISIENVGGTSKGDTLEGNNRANKLAGRNGDDTINGRGGNDTLDGGNGSDTVNGGAGRDKILGGKGSDLLNGNRGNDTIDGGLGNDTIDGGTGNDKITGGQGNDTVSGGGGSDQFIFNSRGRADNGTDHITDFNVDSDSIRLKGGARGDVTVNVVDGNTVIDYEHGIIILDGVDAGKSEIDFIYG